MHIAIGMYSTLSEKTPAPAFERAFSLCYQPLIRWIYSDTSARFSLYQSAPLIKYFEKMHPEVNMAFQALLSKGSLELFTGVYSQSIISQSYPKERSSQLEKMTTLIRRTYRYRPSTAFFFGQVWATSYIHALLNCQISSIAISTYSQDRKKVLFNHPSTMNELGKKIDIYPLADEASRAVSAYAQGEYGLEELKSRLVDVVENNREEDLFIFLNLDQLIEGLLRNKGDEEEDLASLFVAVGKKASELGYENTFLSSFSVRENCYLPSGWYSRDAYSGSLSSFEELFINNGYFRYLRNRYLFYSSILESFRKDRDVKRKSEDEKNSMMSGTLLIHDSQSGPLRSDEHRKFWRLLLEGEKRLRSFGCIYPLEYDFEEVGEKNSIAYNENYQVVYSPYGGSVIEFDLLSDSVNVLDQKSHFDKNFEVFTLKHSFSDKIAYGDKLYKTKHYLFSSDALNKNRREMLFSLDAEELPFSLVKNYKLRTQTFILESTLVAKEAIEDGSYSITLYLAFEESGLSSSEQKTLLLLGELDNVKTIKVSDQNNPFELSFTSTTPFKVTRDQKRQSQYTVLGYETFTLYEKFTFSFPCSLKEGESATYRLLMRANERKY